MKKLNQVNFWKSLPFLLLLVAVVFNFHTLYPELSVRADPNDNIFQFSLVQRMDQVWEQVFSGQKSPIALFDHWVSYWASGYPLPLYYQHWPHLLVVFVYHLLLKRISLYLIFNLIKFVLWVLLPLSFYFGSRWLSLSPLAAGLAAFLGSQVLTDGLYGIDISSFAWRGYGLSTQLFAIFFAPLALGKIYQVIEKKSRKVQVEKRDFLLATLFLAATFASHMAIGYIVALSSLFIPLSFWAIKNLSLKEFVKDLKSVIKNYYLPLALILASCFILLSYWFVPLLLENVYHNISFWDPPVKWNSYGLNNVVSLFLKGDLFDFSRPPILTFLVMIGFLVCLFYFEGYFRLLALLFPFWLALFFGRTTWGSLLNLLPMMKEMHHQRLINALHLVSLPLIGIGAEFVFKKLKKPLLGLGAFILLGFFVYKANYLYLKANTGWIRETNPRYDQVAPDLERLIEKIKQLPPGRVYAGRPGNWGREFKIGATQIYLALSTHQIDLNGFLPESWSLNSDPEPFFNESSLSNFEFYNIRYLVTPKDQALPDFAKLIESFGPFSLSQVETKGFFEIGTSNLLVKSKKDNILNFIHLWLASDLPGKKEFPTLWLTEKAPDLPYPTKITLKQTHLYLKEGQEYSLYSLAYPLASRPDNLGQIIEEKIDQEKYQVKVKIDNDCQDCLVIFKMTYHPNWQVRLDNQKTAKFMVFPSFMAVQIPPGEHLLEYQYQPAPIKGLLLMLGIVLFAGMTAIKTY